MAQSGIERLGQLGSSARSALGRHAPESVRSIARRIGLAGSGGHSIDPGVCADVFFITEDSPSMQTVSDIESLCAQLNSKGLSTHVVRHGDMAAVDCSKVKVLVLVRCPASNVLHDTVINVRGYGGKTVYFLDELSLLGRFADAEEGNVRRGLEGFERDCAARRIVDALGFCDIAFVSANQLAPVVSAFVPEVLCVDGLASNEAETGIAGMAGSASQDLDAGDGGLCERPGPACNDEDGSQEAAVSRALDENSQPFEAAAETEADEDAQNETHVDPKDVGKELPRPLALLAGGAKKVRREGVASTWKAGSRFIHGKAMDLRYDLLNPSKPVFFDVMFINGCDYSVPHPIRYRVDHQIEQLRSNGLSVERIEAWNLKLEDVVRARAFIVFRCPYTSEMGDFVDLAHRLNKVVYFDIDDLVMDRAYTNTIKYIDTMSSIDRAWYDDGVDRMGHMLRECGRAITSTDRLAEELGKVVPEVIINRNTASEEMLYYSNRALYERDVLPLKDESEVGPEEAAQWAWARERWAKRDSNEVVIGYFSGSIAHNDDMVMMLPVLIDVLEQRPNVKLCIAGILDIPKQFEPYSDRIFSSGFGPWKQLPDMIAGVDINIAPLEASIFNEAKSENKWVEAALVKVPTIASNIGAFAKMIEDGKTGVLCDTPEDWLESLLDLVDHPEKRKRIAEAAHEKCVRDCTTIGAGPIFARTLRSRFTKNVFMALPALKTSGGVIVALKHCELLQKHGYDVTIVDIAIKEERYGKPFLGIRGCVFPVLYGRNPRNISEPALFRGWIDKMVATMWSTVWFFDNYPRIGQKLYLVQNYETDFGQPPEIDRILANQTYARDDTCYLTISQWCKGWLEDSFGQMVRYAPNGIDVDAFPVVEREFDGSRRIRILIEGDSDSKHKNVGESFDITNKLDPERFEVWYMSYCGSPKPHWRVDKFLHNVPHDEVGRVYADCDILLKTSILESFSYPPLEMMATGGYVVAIPNGGNKEYLVHGRNCLLFESGDATSAIASIELIANDANVRAKLRQGGMSSVRERSWDVIEDQVVALYDGE